MPKSTNAMDLNHHCMYGLSNNGPKKFRKTPSARRIFTKRFRGFDFWTSLMSIFQNFFDSCANSNRKNNKNISWNRCVILRA